MKEAPRQIEINAEWQFNYDCLLHTLKRLKEADTYSAAHYYALETCRIIMKFHDLREEYISIDNLNAGGH